MSAQKQRILLVEDEPGHVELIRRAFEDQDEMELVVANSLSQAREHMSDPAPDLAIVDWSLPDGSGAELLPGEERYDGVPVVIMTSFGNEKVAVGAMKAGALDYVVKSADALSDMPRTVRRALREWGHIHERKELESQLRHSQQMEAIGRLAGGLAHDLNNALTVILGCNEMLLEAKKTQPRDQTLMEEIDKAGWQAKTLIDQLLAFGRKQALSPVALDLNLMLPNMQTMLERLLGDDIELAMSLAPDLGVVHADWGIAEQWVVNLAVNARDAMPRGGTLTLTTVNEEVVPGEGNPAAVPAGSYVVLSMTDTGAGIPASIQPKIFEPFFTTKGAGRGNGLGLSTVHGMVTQSGGHVVLETEEGVGTTFRIYLPRVQRTVEAAVEAPALYPGTETVLLVEDDARVRAIAEKALEQAGYTVLCATDQEEAIRFAGSHQGDIHVVLTDVVMPGMNGRELADAVKKTRPDATVIYMTGYSGRIAAQHGVVEGEVFLVRKPFTAVGLTRELSAILHGDEAD